MTPRRAARGIAAKLALLIFLIGAVPALGQTALSAEAESADGWWLATGLGAGAVSPDGDLANYRWDTRPAVLYALQATAGRGRFAAGLRFSRWGTTQGTGLLQTTPDPQVRLNALELVGQVRLAEMAGFQFWGSALVGRVGLSYTPDRLVIAGGSAGDLTVSYDPINETSLGLGLELKRAFGNQLTAALQAERSGFQLETSHRRGSEIVTERESFLNWSLRLQVAWLLDLS